MFFRIENYSKMKTERKRDRSYYRVVLVRNEDVKRFETALSTIPIFIGKGCAWDGGGKYTTFVVKLKKQDCVYLKTSFDIKMWKRK